MSETPSELPAAKREIGRLRAENFALKRSLAERERDVTDLRSSTSWRITAPLRTLVNALRQRRWLRRAPAPRTRSATYEIDRDEYQRWVQSYSSVDAAMRAYLASGIGALRGASAHLGDHAELQHRSEMAARGDRVGAQPDLPALGTVHLRRRLDAPRRARADRKLAAQDQRIRVTFRAKNGHISANSNTALDLATGDYVALLDADDLLTEDALFWVAHEIALHPEPT